MQLKTLGGRDDLEVLYTLGLNLTTGTSVIGNAAYWGNSGGITTASMQGKAVTDQGTGPFWRRHLAGIWNQAVAKGAYGLIQVWGIGNVYVVTGTTGPQDGDILIAASATAYTGSTAGLVVGVRSGAAEDASDAMPHVIILSAATAGTFNIGLIRCLH